MKGILFKSELIQAITEGRKTQTRRVMREQCLDIAAYVTSYDEYGGVHIGTDIFPSVVVERPHYQVGETVYIKEAWCESYYGEPICYKLDGKESPGLKGFWRSPMFLKAINARYFLTITDVRAERLQGITLNDALTEGMSHNDLILQFHNLWNSISKDYPWESNPWVFAYSFKKAEQ